MKPIVAWISRVALLLLTVTANTAFGTDGTFNVTESWSVAINNPEVSANFTRTGAESGSVQIIGGRYNLIDHTGLNLSASDLSASIAANGRSTSSETVLYAFASGPGEFYAVVRLSFFAVLVPLQTDWGFTLFSKDQVYTASGLSPNSLSGSGNATDGNNATYDATSTSSLVGFLDTTPPTLSITAPTPGQLVSNASFTVKGAASDNIGVGNVFYSLNNTGFAAAQTTNNWTNWTAPVNLVPGTNTIAAYALDTSGNSSVTNQVNVDFIVTNQLQIRDVGLGTISPNYSNAWLNIGNIYTVTAIPATGFVFTNWITSTNWVGGVISNNATLQFRMASNLTLQASFVETSKPTINITSPVAGQHMSNALATIVGTAADNWGLAGVWCQLNTGPWSAATTTNGWTNWSITTLLVAGTNTLKVYGVNRGGNFSTTNSVSFISSNTFKLQLSFPTATPLTRNGLNLNLQLSTGLNGHIQVSTNLETWVTLTNFVGSNSPLTFLDSAATNFNHRYYRAVIP